MLTGSDLLAKTGSLESQNLTETALARACGYVSATADGKTRVEINKFRRAMLEAHGHSFAPGAIRQRSPRGHVLVSKNGSALLSKSALLQIGAISGKQLKVEAVGGSLVLTPTDSEDSLDTPPVLTTAPPVPALV